MGSLPLTPADGVPATGGASDAERLLTLDLLRGIAAFAVLVRHFPWDGELPVLPSSYLAVDLFFILSGFVIARTYEPRLRERRMTAGAFMRVRLLRLYPLYLAALALALAVYGMGLRAEPIVALGGAQLAATTAFGLLFLPTPESASGMGNLFPVNFPAWSLFFELAVNLLYVAILPRLGPRLLLVLVAAPLGMLWIVAMFTGLLDGGSAWPSFWIGAIRCTFGFFAGVALFRLSARLRAPRLPAWIPCAMLLAVFLADPALGPGLALAGVAVVFPLAVWLGANAAGGPRLDRVSHLFGYLSYPVYVLQVPVMTLLAGLVVLATGEEIARSPAWGVPLYLVVATAAAWGAARWLDDPLRRALRRRRATAALAA